MPPKKKKTASTTRGRKGQFVCPDCGFQAKHAMGLGRHRSARHGTPSKRQQRLENPRATRLQIPDGWLTRREVASRAGVHYNTVRIWERSGKVRTSQLGNQTLIHEGDFNQLNQNRRAFVRPSNTPPPEVFEKLDELTDAFHDLADALELLGRQIRPRRRRSQRG
ncbi:MAG: hypothetical protein ACLGH3_06450 [Actinomycetota bacterium]